MRRHYAQACIATECGDEAAGGTPKEVAQTPFRIDLVRLCADGKLDGYAQSRDYRG